MANPPRLHRNTSANISAGEKIIISTSIIVSVFIMVSFGTGKRKTDHRLAWLPRWLGTGQIGIVSLDNLRIGQWRMQTATRKWRPIQWRRIRLGRRVVVSSWCLLYQTKVPLATSLARISATRSDTSLRMDGWSAMMDASMDSR